MSTGNLPLSGGGIPWGPIIGGVATLGGAYITAQGQKATNAANAQQAKEAMAFEERMSNTAYQRGRKDLEAAGYNPALAYNKGGADTPSGKTANMENALAAFGGSAQAAVETFNSIQRTRADVENTKAQSRLTDAQATQLHLESAARASSIQSEADFNAQTLADRKDIVNSNMLNARYDQRMGQVNLERSLHGWNRDRDVIWPLAVEQLKQDLQATAASTRHSNALARLSELDIPTAENMSRAAKTAWGRNITPFLGDATKIANALSIGFGATRLSGSTSKSIGSAAAQAGRNKPASVDWDDILTRAPKGRRK